MRASASRWSVYLPSQALKYSSLAGEVTRRHVDGVGDLVFVYARDPEGNLIELQSWS